jgi:CYTH domain-containing protein
VFSVRRAAILVDALPFGTNICGLATKKNRHSLFFNVLMWTVDVHGGKRNQVAHRIGTVLNADQVLVLEQGTVVRGQFFNFSLILMRRQVDFGVV